MGVPPPQVIHNHLDLDIGSDAGGGDLLDLQVVWRLNWGHVPEKCSMTSTLLEENRAFGELTCPMAR